MKIIIGIRKLRFHKDLVIQFTNESNCDRSAPEPALHRIVTVSVENLFFFRFSFSLAYIRLFTALSIRYGKYCGIGHSGCPGEEPCDDLDACCMVHDSCVGAKGNKPFENADPLTIWSFKNTNHKVHYTSYSFCWIVRKIYMHIISLAL